MKETTPYGSELKFFLLHGYIPMRQLTARSVPEILHPDGTWHPYCNTYRFLHETETVDREQFDEAVAILLV
jgi:hypothetical protein